MKKVEICINFTAFVFIAFARQGAKATCIVPSIDNGFVRIEGESRSRGSDVDGGDEAEVFCGLGYLAVGGSIKAVCLASGRWMHVDDPKNWPTCQRSDQVYETCGGAIEPKIFGGETADLGEYPWMAKLGVMRVGSASKGICGGILISREWVLTAAHCLTQGGRVTSIDIRLGRVDFESFTTAWEQPRSSQNHTIHPEYRQGGIYNNDFALIKLNHPVHFNQYVRKICLPTREMCRSRSTVRRRSQGAAKIDGCKQGVVAGWGMMNKDNAVHLSSNLQKLNISVLSNLNCINAGLTTTLTNAQLCAGSLIDGQGSCKGDSGGPFMCRKNNKYYALGIVSYGTIDCGIADKPTVYGRVCDALSWISDVISAPLLTRRRTTTTQLVTNPPLPRSCTPPRVRNGHFPGWDGTRNVGKQIIVECNPGYQLKGRKRRIRCRSNLRWTKVKCERDRASSLATTERTRLTTGITINERNRCSSPPAVVNGYSYPVNGEGRPGSRRKVACNNGYESVSDEFMFCGIDLVWHGTWTCQSNAQTTSKPTRAARTTIITTDSHAVACVPPPTILNGYSTLIEGTGLVGSRRQIQCNPGTINLGDDFMTCLPNRQWSGSALCLSLSLRTTTTPRNTYGPGDEVTSSPVVLVRRTAKILDFPEGDQQYGHYNVRCWTFRLDSDYAIKFTLQLIDMESFDTLELFDGQNSHAPLIASLGKERAGSTFYSTNNRAHLCFQSDGSVSGRGFTLRYQAIQRRIGSIYGNVVDCETLKSEGRSNSGIYTIYPNGRSNAGIEVFCDMSTFGGGWTVFQRRVDSTQSFAKNWLEYKNGFGNKRQNFWLGNDALSRITKVPIHLREAGYQLLIKVTTRVEQTSAYVVFDRFFINDESDNYKLNVMEGHMCDTTLAPNGFSDLNQQSFSTYDRDNDNSSTSCSRRLGRGGWWFDSCHFSYLNGIYGKGGNDGGIEWDYILGGTANVQLSRTEMLIRRKPVDAEQYCTIPQEHLDMYLYNAAVGNNTEEALRLLSKGATNAFRSRSLTKTGWTALHWSAGRNNMNITMAIVDLPSTDIDVKKGNNATPLIVAAADGRLAMVRFLVGRGANVNARDDDGNTPLSEAVSRDHTGVAEFLRANGAV